MITSNLICTTVVLFLTIGYTNAGQIFDNTKPYNNDEVDNLEIEEIGNSNNIDLEEPLEGQEIGNEENLRCALHFNRNLHKVLKSFMAVNVTGREGRQKENTDELFSSVMNLEFGQIFGPVVKLLGSAAANNATAIDENYNNLPYAVRTQVTDLIKFVTDLIVLETEGLSPNE